MDGGGGEGGTRRRRGRLFFLVAAVISFVNVVSAGLSGENRKRTGGPARKRIAGTQTPKLLFARDGGVGGGGGDTRKAM